MADYWQAVRRIVSGNSGNAVPRKRSFFEPTPDDLQLMVSREEPADDENTEKISGSPVQNQSRHDPGTGQPEPVVASADSGRTGKQENSLENNRKPVDQVELFERHETPGQVPPPVEASNAATDKQVDVPENIWRAESLTIYDKADIPISQNNAENVTRESHFATDETGSPDVALPVAAKPEPKIESEDADIADIEVQIAQIHSNIEEVVDAIPAPLSEPRQEQLEPAPPQPLLIEIGHVEITIARPSSPAQTPPPARESSKPVIALDAYLAQSDKRQS